MAIKNDLQGRWVNGSLATVDRLEPDRVWVHLDSGSAVVDIERHNWEQIQYRWDEEKKRVVSEVIGSYSQIPLILAWAATIHKAQGLSLDDVRLDLGRGAFAPGQTYVAISLARSLEGLSLAQPLRATDVIVDPILLEFERWSQSN
jgi:ATP-dependent DNA helicase PIF1